MEGRFGRRTQCLAMSRCDRVVRYYTTDSGRDAMRPISGDNNTHLHRETSLRHAGKLYCEWIGDFTFQDKWNEICETKDVDINNLNVIFLKIFHNIFYVIKYKNSHKPYKLVQYVLYRTPNQNVARENWFYSDSDYNFNKEPVIRIRSHNVHCRRCERRNTCKQNKQQVRIFAGRRTQERTQGLLGRVW